MVPQRPLPTSFTSSRAKLSAISSFSKSPASTDVTSSAVLPRLFSSKKKLRQNSSLAFFLPRHSTYLRLPGEISADELSTYSEMSSCKKTSRFCSLVYDYPLLLLEALLSFFGFAEGSISKKFFSRTAGVLDYPTLINNKSFLLFLFIYFWDCIT